MNADTLAEARRLLEANGHTAESVPPADGETANPDPAGGKPSQATKLVTLARDGDTELFHDPDGEPYATFTVDDHQETWPLRSKGFRDSLSRRYYLTYAGVPGGQALQDALGTLAGIARFEGEQHAVFVRLAMHSGRHYLDLGDAQWRAIEIDACGWRVLASTEVPVKFRRPAGLLPLPQPEYGGSLDALRAFVNVADDNAFQLLIGWLVGAFCPDGGRAHLELTGEQGSGKTTVARLLRRTADPAALLLRSVPRDEQALVIAASNNLIPAFDNLSDLKDWQADALCRLSTGGGISQRALYTDFEEVSRDVQRAALWTGINSVATRSDLGDRVLSLTLPSIPPEQRRAEAEVWPAFERAHPAILGALLDAASCALANRDRVALPRKPRLADFAVWVEAAAPALGWEPGAFLDALEAGRRNVDEAAIEAMPIGPAILAFMQDRDTWDGTASDLLAALGEGVAESTRKDRDWPKRANSLSNQLRRIAPNLRQVGVWVGWDRSGHAATRTISLEKNKPVWDRQQRQQRPPTGEKPDEAGETDADHTSAEDRPPSSADRQHRQDENPMESGLFGHAGDADDDLHGFSFDDAAVTCLDCGNPAPADGMRWCMACRVASEGRIVS